MKQRRKEGLRVVHSIFKYCKKCCSLITICSLGPNISYEPQVENINTVEEADAYKEYLVGAMERVQRSKVRISQS